MSTPSGEAEVAVHSSRVPSSPGRWGTFFLKYSFVAPALILLIALNVFPLLYNVVLSFTNTRLETGIENAEWVGGKNYSQIFRDARYAAPLRTTAKFMFLAVSIELVLGFVLALSLREKFRGKTILITLLLVPMMLSPAVMGLYWTLIFDGNYGILNQFLGAIGFSHPPQWLTEYRLTSVLIVDVWMWTPFMMLIALAGLNAIPPYIYEAAEIDRASRWTVFRRITLPMTAPLLLLAVLFRATDALKQFDLVMAIAKPDILDTQTLSVKLYKEIFSSSRVGLGSAYACVVLVAVIALASVFVRYVDSLQKKQGRTAG